MSKHKWDFILYDDKQFEKITFRFYPKYTHVHSFNENPPKTWDEVYKVYYSWKIFITYYDFDDKLDVRSARPLFEMYWDECSEIPNLGNAIRWVIENKPKEDVNMMPFGQPAGEWIIKYIKKDFEDIPELNEEYLKFTLWNTGDDTGYRFSLSIKEALKFADFIDEVNKYALEHGEEI